MRVAVLSVVPLAMKFTLPVGVPPLPVTLAVMVMAAPTSAGLGVTAITVAVVASEMVSEGGDEVLLPLLASPV